MTVYEAKRYRVDKEPPLSASSNFESEIPAAPSAEVTHVWALETNAQGEQVRLGFRRWTAADLRRALPGREFGFDDDSWIGCDKPLDEMGWYAWPDLFDEWPMVTDEPSDEDDVCCLHCLLPYRIPAGALHADIMPAVSR